MKVTAIECPRCGQIIWIEPGNADAECHCNYCFIRQIWDNSEIEIFIRTGWQVGKYPTPKIIENFEVDDDTL